LTLFSGIRRIPIQGFRRHFDYRERFARHQGVVGRFKMGELGNFVQEKLYTGQNVPRCICSLKFMCRFVAVLNFPSKC
jgi:hypothetical protein